MITVERAVFDTNILIDFSHGDPRAADVLRSCRERFISVVTWIEFLTGIPDNQMESARAFLNDMFQIIYPEELDYETILEIRREKRIKLPDAMIYASAQLQESQLVTRNTKDFDETMENVYVPYV